MIELIDVTKKYSDGVVALDEVTLKIEPREFVFIVGASGVGKSTLLKLVVREDNPTKGKVIVDGEDVSILKDSLIPNLRRKVGFVFQDFRLLNNKSVFDNVALALEVVDISDKEINKRVPEILEKVGLEKKIKNYPKELSGGEKQRLAIARALVHEPKIILADEPTGMIDPISSWEVIKLLEKVNSWGSTVVMATHDTSIVDSLKKRVIELRDGKVFRDEKRGRYVKC